MEGMSVHTGGGELGMYSDGHADDGDVQVRDGAPPEEAVSGLAVVAGWMLHEWGLALIQCVRSRLA